MRKSNRLNVLLMEIVIATLFFALASTVILKVYVSTRHQTMLAKIGNDVENEVQNLSEECYAAEDVTAVFLAHSFVQEESRYVFEGDEYRITAEVKVEETGNGALRIVQIDADIMGEASLSLPSVRYIPEVAEQ